MKTPLVIAKAAVKAAAEELGISYKKALVLMIEEYQGCSYETEAAEASEPSQKSRAPSTMAREILRGILNNPQYLRVSQYVFSIKQLNREDQAYIIANLGSVGYSIQSAIMAELEK